MYVVCEPGLYGADCALKCGYCLRSEPCHHINGSCPWGCQEGFTGDMCNSCKIILRTLFALIRCIKDIIFFNILQEKMFSFPISNISVKQCFSNLVNALFVACRFGFHGEDCALKCGHCLESEPCDYVNGSCPRGCQDGFKGDRCSNGKDIFYHDLFGVQYLRFFMLYSRV